MRKSLTISLYLLAAAGMTTAASLWATTVPPHPLAAAMQTAAPTAEKIAPYQARFGRKRPLIAVVGENGATELTDFVIPYGILAEAGVADLVTVATKPGAMTMRPALHLQPDTTVADFDKLYPDGADYVIVPMVVKYEDRALLAWLQRQSAKGSTIVSICDGALVVASAGLTDGHRATAHWATLGARRKQFPKATWIENTRYVADGRIVSSAGISASIPITLALVEAIAGTDRATELARSLAVRDWSTKHNSEIFAPRFGQNLTALASTYAINPALRRQEAVGIPIAPGVDEIALALTADGYSRTGRGKAYTLSATDAPIRTRHGLTFLPDRITGSRDAVDRIVQLSDTPPGAQIDVVLAAIERDYGRLAAFGVALQLEYPDFQ